MWCERKTQQRNERFRNFRICRCVCVRTAAAVRKIRKECPCDSLSFTNSIIINSSSCVAIVSILFSPLVKLTLFRTLAHRCSRSDATNNRTNEWRSWRAIFSLTSQIFSLYQLFLLKRTIFISTYFGFSVVVVGGNDFKSDPVGYFLLFDFAVDAVASMKKVSSHASTWYFSHSYCQLNTK